jgi:uncharacterized protein YjbI with pentapeptide repeats
MRSLREILDDHALWQASDYEDGQRADLSGVDLSRRDLRNVNLAEARLVFCDFTGSDVRGANFQGADLTFSSFRNALTDGADFTGARLKCVCWQAPDSLENLIWSLDRGLPIHK